jgi:hypothetical protein
MKNEWSGDQYIILYHSLPSWIRQKAWGCLFQNKTKAHRLASHVCSVMILLIDSWYSKSSALKPRPGAASPGGQKRPHWGGRASWSRALPWGTRTNSAGAPRAVAPVAPVAPGKGYWVQSSASPQLIRWSRGFTPLLCAAERGHAEVVKLLLQSGASVEAKTKDGQGPSWGAHYPLIRWFVDDNAVW